MVTARSLNKRSTTILIAVVLALGTGLLFFNYLSTVQHSAQTEATRSVVVATREIAPHTIIRPEMVTIADRAQDSVDPDASTTIGAVAGQMALIDIPAGSALSTAKIGHLASGGLTMRVPVGQRAISIALDPVKGVADLMQAGDHVDVIAVTQARGSAESSHAYTILRNKMVLAMGTSMEPAVAATGAQAPAAGSSDAAIQTATLAVLPTEAKKLALADLNGTLRLALRSPRESGRSEQGDDFVVAAPIDRAPAAAPAAVTAPVAHAAVALAPVRPAGIPLIDGDRIVR